MSVPTIVGFATNNRVPGVYGETVYGAGAISAASVPLVLLLVGTMISPGSAVSNQDVKSILSEDDANTYFGAGSELARMCYSALKVPGVNIKAAPVAEAGGAVAATQVITISGTWTSSGQVSYRVNGEVVSLVIGGTDSTSQVATNLAAQFNQDPKRPYVAAASGSQVTLTLKSKGARGNGYITFQDTSLAPSGFVTTIAGATWAGGVAKTTSSPVSFVVPTVSNGYYYKCTVAGTTAASPEPTWPTSIGGTVTDGTVTWTCWGKVLPGSATTWGGGTGTEDVATLLGVLTPTQYDRIVTSEIDSTNLGKWVTFLNTQAGPTSNILEHLICATNGTLAATTTLATVTLNAQRVQIMWQLNGETAPWEAAAYFGAYRCSSEQQDPAASYDDIVLPIAPQSQPSDRPSNPVLQSAVNNGITPIYTSVSGSQALLCISITSHSLNGSTPDYRTFNTSDAYVPDFVRKDIGLYWTTVFKPSNPRVNDDPPGDAKPLASGIATPTTWNAEITAKLKKYEKGILASGSDVTKPQVAPIIVDVDQNPPTTVYDPVAKRLVSIIPVVPAPPNHQLGISVRQVTSS